MKVWSGILFVINTILIAMAANLGYQIQENLWFILVAVAMVSVGCLLAHFPRRKHLGKRFLLCAYGNRCLRLFIVTAVITVIYQIAMALVYDVGTWKNRIISICMAVLVEAFIFWIGIIAVYATSTQLGIKIKTLGIVFGMTPIVNLFMLGIIINTTDKEIDFEWKKALLNVQRKDEKVCATKYPLLMVHGVFFRDYKKFNYWGRIPEELIKNGATIYYGEHQSALSVEDSGAELAKRVKEIVKDTGCEKVNIIAHSKGGLDSRMAIFAHDLEGYVASLTTISSPHRGCKFADYLLNITPEGVKNKVVAGYNGAMKRLGDTNPDFMAAVKDLTSERATYLDGLMTTPKNVYCQSVGSKLVKATNGRFPLNFSYVLVKHFDGYNDGLVGEESFEWGEKYIFLNDDCDRGISHGDVIDLNRKNMPGFDVREWYVELVSDLKNKGY